MRIAVAGFQHETNTFAPSCADWDAFRIADSWPPLLLGDAVCNDTRGYNLPIAGAIAAAEAQGAEILPILWCAAEPSGPVTGDAFERVAGMILDGIAAAGAIDGLYLDLHGAMVTDHEDSGELALLQRIRDRFGPDLPIAVSLDLHANIPPGLVACATVITIYRTYPHLDMADTGARAMGHLLRAIGGQPYVSAFRQVDFLVPLHAQCTDLEPARSLYASVACSDTGNGSFADLALGFTAADVPECGPAIVAYGPDKNTAGVLADRIAAQMQNLRTRFETALTPPRQAIAQARAVARRRPVVLADVQDNPGAGGSSDTTGLLHALIAAGAQRVALGVVCDPDLAQRAHAAGQGHRVAGPLGARHGFSDPPVDGPFDVRVLSAGKIPYTGEMYGGGIATLGPSCLLHCAENGSDISVVVSSQRVQCLDQALFRHFGVALEDLDLICVKSTVHHRADFAGLAHSVVNVRCHGAFPCDLDLSAFKRLRGGVGLAGNTV